MRKRMRRGRRGGVVWRQGEHFQPEPESHWNTSELNGKLDALEAMMVRVFGPSYQEEHQYPDGEVPMVCRRAKRRVEG